MIIICKNNIQELPKICKNNDCKIKKLMIKSVENVKRSTISFEEEETKKQE
jgi:hypothetical protein